jgi:cephalosporin-C deacetylase-like acetyl esterase
MCAQFILEVICKRSQKKGRPPNFQEFWNEEVHFTKDLQKRKL